MKKNYSGRKGRFIFSFSIERNIIETPRGTRVCTVYYVASVLPAPGQPVSRLLLI